MITTTYCEKQQPLVSINLHKILEPVLDYGEDTLQAITNLTDKIVKEPLTDDAARSNEAKIVGGLQNQITLKVYIAVFLKNTTLVLGENG